MKINTLQKQSLLIKGILNLSNLEKITIDAGKIHKVFYRLKQEFPQYFERLLFDTNGHIPVSEDLTDILGTFKLSGIINWEGCRHYRLYKDEKCAERINKQFPDIDISEIQKIADKFREYIQ